MHYIIVNPAAHSKAAAEILPKLRTALADAKKEYKICKTRYPGHARHLAAVISRRDPEATVIAVGGDGSIHEIICGLQNLKTIRFGVIPFGSGNDFARGMKIPVLKTGHINAVLGRAADRIGLAGGRKKQEKFSALDSSHMVKTDIGFARTGDFSDRFAVSCGIGFDAAICHEALHSEIKTFLNRFGLGKLTYVLIALKQFVKLRQHRAVLELDEQKPLYFKHTIFIAVMNQPFEGGGLMFGPDAKPDDGILNVTVCEGMPRAELILAMILGPKGKLKHLPGAHFFQCRKCVIRTDEKLPIHVDGEDGGISDRLEVTLAKDQLNVVGSGL